MFAVVFFGHSSQGWGVISVTDFIDSFSQVDLFELEAVDLQEPKRVIIGHDGDGIGSGWFLDKVTVKVADDADKEYNFPCNRFELATI